MGIGYGSILADNDDQMIPSTRNVKMTGIDLEEFDL